jgi:hypothetical protein
MDDEQNRLMVKEQWLREEIRHSRTMTMNLVQWGITVLVAAESYLYYVRKDITERLVSLHVLSQGEPPPLLRWLLGTFFLTLIATCFSSLLLYNRRKHISYRTQLHGMNPSYSGIEEKPPGTKLHLMPHLLFFAFPLFDCVFRIALSAARSFNLNISW